MISDHPAPNRKKISIKSQVNYKNDATSIVSEERVVKVDEMFEDIVRETKKLREALKKITVEKDNLQQELDLSHREIRSLKQEINLLEKQKSYYEMQYSSSESVIKELRENHEKERQALEKVIQTQNSAFSRVLKKKEKLADDFMRKSIVLTESSISSEQDMNPDVLANFKKKIFLLENNIRSLLTEKKTILAESAKQAEKFDQKEAELANLKAENRLLKMENETLNSSNREFSQIIEDFKLKMNKPKAEIGVQSENDEKIESRLMESIQLKELETVSNTLTDKLEVMVLREIELQRQYDDARFKIKCMEKILKDKGFKL